MPDLPLLSEVPYIAILGAEVLFIWLFMTGLALLVARMIGRVRSTH
jgi:hypothetical protein